MSERIYLRDVAPAEIIEGVFAIQNAQLGQTKGGKPFLKCLIADKTGRAPGRMWTISEHQFQRLPTNGFVRLVGQTQPYQGEMQVIIQSIEPVEPSDEELSELLPSTWRDVDEMFEQVTARLRTVRDPGLAALAQAYLADAELMAKFRQAPAAVQLHHAYLGGLLEHTLALLDLAERVLPLYPQLNPELVKMGLFLHDLGKCAELTWQRGFAYTDSGNLVGHVATGLVWLHEKAAAVKLKPAVRDVLAHMILSHHGQPEFGALKVPATPEAMAVSMLDNLDAKLHMAIAATRLDDAARSEELGGHFTEKIWALDTRLYRPDPTMLPD